MRRLGSEDLCCRDSEGRVVLELGQTSRKRWPLLAGSFDGAFRKGDAAGGPKAASAGILELMEPVAENKPMAREILHVFALQIPPVDSYVAEATALAELLATIRRFLEEWSVETSLMLLAHAHW